MTAVPTPRVFNNTTKQAIYEILSNQSNQRIVDVKHELNKSKGISISYQAVRKALNELQEQGVLACNESKYDISKKWTKNLKQHADKLYKEKKTLTKTKPREKSTSNYNFESLSEMMNFWHLAVNEWIEQTSTKDAINCWQGAHLWEGLLQLEMEKKVMSALQDKGIKSYALSSGKTKLDENIWKFYRKLGVQVYTTDAEIDPTQYIGTYGDMIIQATYPKNIANELDEFFKSQSTLEELDLSLLAKIVNRKIFVEVTAITNPILAKHTRTQILRYFPKN